MTRPHTILLVPNDPAMLDEDAFGGRPPMMGLHDGYWYEYDHDGSLAMMEQGPDGHYDTPPAEQRGLVLAHDGEVYEIGLAWLGVTIGTGPMDAMRVAVRHVLLSPEPASWAHTRLSEWGTLVYLDADGKVLDA